MRIYPNRWQLVVEKASTYHREVQYDRPWYGPALNLVSTLTVKSKDRIIELGSGNGEFAKKLMEFTPNVVALDGSTAHQNTGKEMGVDIQYCNFEVNLPFDSNSFDVAVSLEVIEHIANAELFLSEIYRVIKPNAHLIISTPNVAHIGFRYKALLGEMPPLEGQHLRFWNIQGFISLLESSGFSVDTIIALGPIPGVGKMRRLLKMRGGSWFVEFPKVLRNILGLHTVVLCQKRVE